MKPRFTLSFMHPFEGGSFWRRLGAFLGYYLEALFGVHHLSRLYDRVTGAEDSDAFVKHLQAVMEITADFNHDDLAQVPASGSVVVVANHPFGGVEGVILLDLLRKRRSDVKVMANYLLRMIPELRDDLILVDPFGGVESKQRNVRAMREALNWLRNGHVLIVFPAGEVASFNWRLLRVVDPIWRRSIAGLLRSVKHEVSILPIFIPGRNSILFNVLGVIHARLRTILLPRQFLRQIKRKVTLHIGSPFSATALIEQWSNDTEVMRVLRLRTMILGKRGKSSFDRHMQILTLDGPGPKPNAIIDEVPRDILAEEITGLSPDRLLIDGEAMQVWCILPEEAPAVMNEIGRLRELTFRRVGEGTGQQIDLDEFDLHYRHLFIWHKERHEIIGSYRLGLTDEIIEQFGVQALYTRTLFKFDERLFGAMGGPALELGRSFVRAEYQRSFSPLLLLWRGVMRFAYLHPRYTTLFGPVSITHEFNRAARSLIITYLMRGHWDEPLSKFVSARLPPKKPLLAEWAQSEYAELLTSFDEVNHLVGEIEHGLREIPVLIKQYLKLGGKMISFNVDPSFNTVDGMIIVNLLKAPAKGLGRYMGKEELQAYWAFHGQAVGELGEHPPKECESC